MWLLVCVVSGLAEGLLGKRGLAVLLSDMTLVYVISFLVKGLQSPRGLTVLLAIVTHSVCPFWFSRGIAESERAGCLAFLCGS